VKLTVNIDLSLCDVTCQIWDRMGDICKKQQEEKELLKTSHW